MSYHAPITIPPAPAVDEAVPAVRTRSLVLQVARKMVLWACVNTLVLTAIGYFFVSERVEQRTLAYLSGYLSERLRAESQVFRAGEANLKTFDAEFLRLYLNPEVLSEFNFSDFFEPKPDGSVRLKEKYFTGTVDANGVYRKDVTGFVASQGPFTREFQRRLLLTQRMVSQYGPAWHGQFANLYAQVPENGGSIYWPNVPWALRVPVTRAARHIAGPTWTPLYFDAVAQRWNVTYQNAVFLNGRPLIYSGHDILLDDLMDRLVHDHPEGAYNFIAGKDGDLIAHPSRIKDLKRSDFGPKISKLGDPILLSMYRSIAEDLRHRKPGEGVRIVENADADAYICYGEIAGPGWLFVTVYPRSLVLESAHEAANGLLLLGLGSFAIMTLIVVWVLRERVSRPISQMRVASERVSWGDYDAIADGTVRLPEEEDNEIGLFAQSFKSMAKKVGETHLELEETVLERTRELQVANRELEKLSFKDSLTGAYNRRCFDRDLARLLEAAPTSEGVTCLLLCDIDYFKFYNDTYGHVAGDGVLKTVAEEMMRVAPAARVYRYGGEELALLMTNTEIAQCRRVAGKVVEGVSGLGINHEKSPYGIVTLSAGFVSLNSCPDDAPSVIRAADALLYQAKLLGRNRLIDGEASLQASG